MSSWQIVDEIRFSEFNALLQSYGWRRDSDVTVVDGVEPAFASWSREPDGELDYVYNARTGLRALSIRGEDVGAYLRELVERLPLSPSPLPLELWEQARFQEARFQEARTPDARAGAYAAIELIRAQVEPLLWALAHDSSGELRARVIPQAGDYEKVFLGPAAQAAEKVYGEFWSAEHPLQLPGPAQTDLLCFIAPAGMLATENELSRPFPGGYRLLARWLEPSRVWVAWKLVEPGESSGLAFNGLVWVDDHWAWFPKPYRVLRAFLSDRG